MSDDAVTIEQLQAEIVYLRTENARLYQRLNTAGYHSDTQHQSWFHPQELPLAVIEWDQDFRVQRWSRQAELFFGWNAEDVIGKHWSELNLVYPEDQQAVVAIVKRLLDGTAQYACMSNRNLTRNGMVIPCEWYSAAFFDADGHLVSAFSLVQNVAERVQEETALRASQAFLQEFLNYSPAVVFAKDLEGRYLLVNEHLAVLMHIPIEAFMGKTDHELFSSKGEIVTQVRSNDQRIVMTGTAIEFEEEVPLDDGLHTYLSIKFPIYDLHGHIIAVGGIATDITERKRADAALQADRATLTQRVAERTSELSLANAELVRAVRAKDEFLANMSHELRTPLNAVLGLSEALQEEVYGTLTEKQRFSLQTIEESGRHLLNLINDILDLAKIEAGREELSLADVAIESVCQASLRMIKQVAQKKNLRVIESFQMNVPSMQADERRLKQILVNLLSNAVKFTPEGGQVGLEVTTNTEHNQVYFTVWDTGIGIAPEHLERLFKPFSQIDGGLNRRHDGTGLGLSLVMRLAEMHGGSVAVASEVGQGSRFTVTLPQLTSALSAISPAAHPTLTAPPSDHVPRWALLIEDSLTAADQIARYLSNMGLQSVISTRGLDAVNQALDIKPDIILLDILLIDISGWSILQALKANPRTQHIPVVVISVIDDPKQAQALGAAASLVKPISRAQLQAVITTIFPGQPATPSTALVVVPETAVPENVPRILLTDDNETTIAMLSEYLQVHGYQVIVARNGVEAIQRATEASPDLILMDIQMPRIDGLEAIRRIRAMHSLADTPIIALTALAMPGDEERCLEAGANAYLSKPVRLRDVIQIIETYLDRNR
jgi:PAS domain S-box-containing protein